MHPKDLPPCLRANARGGAALRLAQACQDDALRQRALGLDAGQDPAALLHRWRELSGLSDPATASPPRIVHPAAGS